MVDLRSEIKIYASTLILIIATNEVCSLSLESLHKCSTHFESFGQLALYLRAKLSMVEFEEFAILCNMVWQQRNNWVFEGRLQDPAFVIVSGMQWPFDFSTNNSNVQGALLWPATSFSCVYTLLGYCTMFRLK